MAIQPTCRWVIQAATADSPAVYCCNKVAYQYVVLDDGTRRRVYDTFCSEHAARAQHEDEEEDEE